MITFGRKLKHLRQKNHLTQKELGIAVGFPDSCADVRIAQRRIFSIITPKNDKREAAEKPLPHFSIMTINLVPPLTHTSNILPLHTL